MKFASCFGNRGFYPGERVASAIVEDFSNELGHDVERI